MPSSSNTIIRTPSDSRIFKGAEILRSQLLSNKGSNKGSNKEGDKIRSLRTDRVKSNLQSARRRTGNADVPQPPQDDDASLWSDPWRKDPWKKKVQVRVTPETKSNFRQEPEGKSPQDILDSWAEDIVINRRRSSTKRNISDENVVTPTSTSTKRNIGDENVVSPTSTISNESYKYSHLRELWLDKEAGDSFPLNPPSVLIDPTASASSAEIPPPPPNQPPPVAMKVTPPSSSNDSASFATPEFVLPPPPPPPVDEYETPESTMGRNRSLRMKVETYLVEPYLDDGSGFSSYTDQDGEEQCYGDGLYSGGVATGVYEHEDDGTYSEESKTSSNHQNRAFREEQQDDCPPVYSNREEEHPPGYVPTKYQQDQPSPPSCSHKTSPKILRTSSALRYYSNLIDDPAYLHARTAGILWQNLVAQHVRFPSKWWNGARAPPMGMDESIQEPWKYVARHRVQTNEVFNSFVKHRSAPGRILLHVIVRDLMTWKPMQDIVIGCFHPNARGVRKTREVDLKEENCREVWMATRKRCSGESVSLIDPLLMSNATYMLGKQNESPLGDRKSVTNMNMRAVFGEKPPISTIFILESELYEKISNAGTSAPALVLLQGFLLQRKVAPRPLDPVS